MPIVDGFSSEIKLTDVAGPMRVKTFSGGVTLQARSWADGDDLNVNTFSGDVSLQLPDNARGRHRLRQLQRDVPQRSAGDALTRAASATSAAISTAAGPRTSG